MNLFNLKPYIKTISSFMFQNYVKLKFKLV